MKKTFTIILIIAVTLLAVAFGLDNIARANAQKEHVWLMETLLPGGKDFKLVPYDGEDPMIRSVHQAEAGFVIETATQGYADEIVMFIGVDNDGKVTGLVVYEAHETQGLGSKILTDHVFLSQFLNKNGSFTIGTAGSDAFSGATGEVESTGDEIAVDGITGATVSSKAVARCVNAAVAYVTGADIDSSATTWGG
jgi:electron transport complex protein RnfG